LTSRVACVLTSNVENFFSVTENIFKIMMENKN
jgi:hypothetical protein